ncbi:response regulator transcription factor [candidate division KSB1 bacterium]|nr:response regulator transcription factor [candidate division KSB1 bacterium]
MRILIIEDQSEVAAFVKKVLLEENHAIDIAHDGAKGEYLTLTEPYDLIILDIMLPRQDGFAVLKSLRAEKIATPVLMLTARSEVPDRVAGLDAGADDYLVKPFAVAELRARVRALLRRHSAEKSPLLTVGELTLNSINHEVRIQSELIELTTREYAILEYLLRNKNRLLSKGMIAEHVWDFHFSSDYNLIEVYIRRLRKKIESKSQTKIIHTIRNSGYIIRDVEK